ncbi:MAG: valine--tRNA ligase [Hyphomicrobiales bacterium]
MLEKTYQPASVEGRIYEAWEKGGAFKAGAGSTGGADPYCIVIPPPNVTGSLHMGHALNNTLQDVLIRYHRMQGRDVLWQPGTDHAGIATQMVVERQLAANGEPGRRDMGREAFVERVWQWKGQSGGTIINQLKRLGASCDWSRERFTMDEGLSEAVLEVFVKLFHEGLIYKDKRLVNWDPKFHTAISDLEVQQVEIKGNLWHFKYPIEGQPGRFITVATTRPETMLGDTAVAVHPSDERYTDLVGKHCVLPLVGRRIPIVGDEYADPETGSGAVKITPAHDFNDFEVGRRNGLAMISILDQEAALDLAGNEDFLRDVSPSDELNETLTLHGLDRFAARKAVVERMEALGLLEMIEDHVHMVPHGDRSGVVIEPWLTDQWYVDAKTLAEPAIAAVREERTVFVPKNWERTYYDWMENIQPWCISRQLWWGHQIPAWYGPDGAVFVARSEADAKVDAEKHFGRSVEVVSRSEAMARWLNEGIEPIALYRDEDVLDTWFSSALWPFSTLGWPDKTAELERYYQTDVLVTGFDIIFFWVARMMMMGLHFMKEEPFHTVYIHALVRDEKGQKMSKSKGNVIDPLELVDEYGADALRFTLTAMAAQGRDIKLSPARVAGYRNFATKLWNASRFCEMNECVRVEGFDPQAAREIINRWIVVEADRAADAVAEALAAYKFNEAAGSLYRFVWNTFCDWYLELAKPALSGEDGAAKDETRATAAFVLDRILVLLHPFMPFITEELWGLIGEAGPARAGMLAMSHWPAATGLDAAAADEINWLVDLITQIRSVRAEMNVPAGAMIPVVVVGGGSETRMRLVTHDAALRRLARLESVAVAEEAPEGAVQIMAGDAVAWLPLAGVIDISAEKTRLAKELDKIAKDVARIDGKLGNEQFLSKAPEEIIEAEREKRDEALSRRAKIEEALARLG